HYNNGQGQYGVPEPSLVAGGHFDEEDAGTLSKPMSLSSAIATAHPGDLYWLLERTYTGPFTLSTSGKSVQPIVYRAYPGHHATVIGNFVQDGAYNWLWGLEITDPDGIGISSGINANAPGLHVINCYIHHNLNNNGIGAWSKGVDHVYYGNIVH